MTRDGEYHCECCDKILDEGFIRKHPYRYARGFCCDVRCVAGAEKKHRQVSLELTTYIHTHLSSLFPTMLIKKWSGPSIKIAIGPREPDGENFTMEMSYWASGVSLKIEILAINRIIFDFGLRCSDGREAFRVPRYFVSFGNFEKFLNRSYTCITKINFIIDAVKKMDAVHDKRSKQLFRKAIEQYPYPLCNGGFIHEEMK
jgi:hypothetical protein